MVVVATASGGRRRRRTRTRTRAATLATTSNDRHRGGPVCLCQSVAVCVAVYGAVCGAVCGGGGGGGGATVVCKRKLRKIRQLPRQPISVKNEHFLDHTNSQCPTIMRNQRDAAWVDWTGIGHLFSSAVIPSSASVHFINSSTLMRRCRCLCPTIIKR